MGICTGAGHDSDLAPLSGAHSSPGRLNGFSVLDEVSVVACRCRCYIFALLLLWRYLQATGKAHILPCRTQAAIWHSWETGRSCHVMFDSFTRPSCEAGTTSRHDTSRISLLLQCQSLVHIH